MARRMSYHQYVFHTALAGNILICCGLSHLREEMGKRRHPHKEKERGKRVGEEEEMRTISLLHPFKVKKCKCDTKENGNKHRPYFPLPLSL